MELAAIRQMVPWRFIKDSYGELEISREQTCTKPEPRRQRTWKNFSVTSW